MIKQLYFCVLLALLLSVRAEAAPLYQESPAEKEVLFSWGKDCAITMVRDLTDWDINKDSGEQYFVLNSIDYNCSFDRDVNFDFRLKEDRFKRNTLVVKEVDAPLSMPLWITRVTEENLSWNFTPAHVDTLPGSVSIPTLLAAGGSETDSSSVVTTAFTPTANSFIVASIGHGDAGGATADAGITDDAGADIGTWTTQFDLIDSPDNLLRLTGYWAIASATPVSSIITFSFAANDNRRVYNVVEFTGVNNSSPISESGTATSLGATTESITLVDIAADNLAYGVIAGYGAAGISPGTNETELASSEVVSGANSPILTMQSEYGTDNVVDWSSLSSSGNHDAFAMEIAQAAAAATVQVIMVD